MILNARFFGIPYAEALLIILNLIIIESMLSVDNAAVLASMAMKLPKEERGKALRYGLFGAYFFRGIFLVLAGWLVHFWWLKLIGGGYLLFQAFRYFINRGKHEQDEEKDTKESRKPKIIKFIKGKTGPFWGTVIAIELMDLAFSLDNVLAAVAYTDPGHFADETTKRGSLYLLWLGVFIGILAMRFVAQAFVKLMEKFPFLETAAFIVIGFLGVKITFDGVISRFPNSYIGSLMNNETIKHFLDLGISLCTIGIFVFPIIFSLLFKKHKAKKANK